MTPCIGCGDPCRADVCPFCFFLLAVRRQAMEFEQTQLDAVDIEIIESRKLNESLRVD